MLPLILFAPPRAMPATAAVLASAISAADMLMRGCHFSPFISPIRHLLIIVVFQQSCYYLPCLMLLMPPLMSGCPDAAGVLAARLYASAALMPRDADVARRPADARALRDAAATFQ